MWLKSGGKIKLFEGYLKCDFIYLKMCKKNLGQLRI